jgi:hypothetical protein
LNLKAAPQKLNVFPAIGRGFGVAKTALGNRYIVECIAENIISTTFFIACKGGPADSSRIATFGRLV